MDAWSLKHRDADADLAFWELAHLCPVPLVPRTGRIDQGGEAEDELDEDGECSTDLEPVEEVDAQPVSEVRPLPGTSTGRHSVIISEERGPLPPRRWLETAERHAPGVTRQLVDDFLAQRRHTRALERRALRQDEVVFAEFGRFQFMQLKFVGVIALVIAAGGIALAMSGRSVLGFSVLIGEISVLVLAFLYGRSQEHETRDDESPGE